MLQAQAHTRVGGLGEGSARGTSGATWRVTAMESAVKGNRSASTRSRATGGLQWLLRGIAWASLLLSLCAAADGGKLTVAAFILASYSLLYAVMALIGSLAWVDLLLALVSVVVLIRMIF